MSRLNTHERIYLAMTALGLLGFAASIAGSLM